MHGRPSFSGSRNLARLDKARQGGSALDGRPFAPEVRGPTGVLSMAEGRVDRAGRGTRRGVEQETGSKRPAPRVGAAKVAPKKRTVEPKGTARPGAAKKSRPGKSSSPRKVVSK